MANKNFTKKNTYKKGNKNSGKGSNAKDMKDDRIIAASEDHRDSRVNDISHHAKDAQLLSDAASFPYSNALGTLFQWRDGDDTSVDSIPGVCALVSHPMIGKAEAWNDPINIAARALYSWVRHANSGHTNYEAADLAMYIYGMANLDAYIEWAKRLYGLCANYSFKNRYTPKALVEANGVSFESITNNLANFRYGLNMAIKKRNSLAVPKNMALYQRMKWMYSGVYRDANNPKAQLYMLVPDGFYLCNVGGGVDTTHMVYAKLSGNFGALPDTLLQWDDVIDGLNDIINAIWGLEDFNIMSGDILKCYGQENCETADEITDNFTTNIGYEFEVLSEIQNATVLHCNVLSDVIYQNPDIGKGQIYYKPRLEYADKFNAIFCTERRMVTVPYPDPKPGDTMVATRFTVIPNVANNEGVFDDEHTVGTELITGMRVAKIIRNSENEIVIDWEYKFAYSMHPDTGADYFSDVLAKVGDISKFDYHPAINMTMHTGDTALQTKPTRLFDVDNYTLMDAKDLRKMHALSVWTQFDWA